MLIDTHCHLNFKAFRDDYHQVCARAWAKNVKKIIVVGASLASSERAVALAQELDGCFAVVGIHPHHVREYMDIGREQAKKCLTDLLKKPKVIALGETGLDFYPYKNYPLVGDEEKKAQHDLLSLHLELSRNHHLPLIFHCREAQDDMLNFLFSTVQKSGPVRGIFHCFGGTREHLRQILSMGMYLGFDGNISYPENENLRALVKETPPDRLLLETDAPFLTPFPKRRERNEPANVTIVASWIARIWGKPLEEVEAQTTINATTLFDLS